MVPNSLDLPELFDIADKRHQKAARKWLNDHADLSLPFAYSFSICCALGPSPCRKSSTAFFVASCSSLLCSPCNARKYLAHVSSSGGIGSLGSRCCCENVLDSDIGWWRITIVIWKEAEKACVCFGAFSFGFYVLGVPGRKYCRTFKLPSLNH